MFSGCLPDYGNARAWLYWVPAVIFETVLVVLALAKLKDISRFENAPSPILEVLIRDSLVYFAGVLAIILSNLFAFALARVSACLAQILRRCAHILLLTSGHSSPSLYGMYRVACDLGRFADGFIVLASLYTRFWDAECW